MTLPVDGSWERWSRVLDDWIPYLTLAIAMVLSLAQADQSVIEQIKTTMLAAFTAGWVFVMHTRAPQPRRTQTVRMLAYFAGMLGLGTLLMVRQPIFFVFILTGFVHASLLRPWPLMVLGIAATSILINTIITGFPWTTSDKWFIFGLIIVIQTLAISFGTLMSERLAEVSEQRRQALARLEATLEENAGLHAQLLAQAREAGVLDERQRMAREIHDTLAQGLTGIITQLEAAKQAQDRPDDWQRHLANAAQLTRTSLSEARRSVAASRPESLELSSLPVALADVAQHWSGMNGIAVEVTMSGDAQSLHPEIEVALLRTAQEALTNIARHAHATRVGVTLSYMGDEVVLDVRDDGIGFEPVTPTGDGGTGFGLIAMRQRVNRVAGTLAIESEPGGGTAVSARIPALPAPQEASAS